MEEQLSTTLSTIASTPDKGVNGLFDSYVGYYDVNDEQVMDDQEHRLGWLAERVELDGADPLSVSPKKKRIRIAVKEERWWPAAKKAAAS